MKKPTRRSVPYGHPRSERGAVTPPSLRRGSAIPPQVRRAEPDSDSLGAWMFDENGEPLTERDAFTQLEDTDAATGVAPGDAGSGMPFEGDK